MRKHFSLVVPAICGAGITMTFTSPPSLTIKENIPNWYYYFTGSKLPSGIVDFPHTDAIVLCIFLLWFIGWVYYHWGQEWIRKLKSKPRIPAAPILIGEPESAPTSAYNPNWQHLDSFELWQVACLWVGEEPKRPILEGSLAYPILKLLGNAIDEKTLITTSRSKALPRAYCMVRSVDVGMFALRKRLSPAFPFKVPPHQNP